MLYRYGGKKKVNEGVTVITPTGDRPLAFALCQRWMRNQTRQPDQWIVVDDGKTPLTPGPMMQYVRREPRLDDPKHTLITNLAVAAPLIRGNKILIMEDDEYYAPLYVEEMASRLEKYEVVGICRSKYYHLPTGGFIRHSNIDHASLAQTGFRSSFVPSVAGLFTGDTYLDIRIWKKVGNVKTLKWGEPTVVINFHTVGNGRGLLFDDGDDKGCLYVGIKGLPGRPGIGCGHRDYSEYLPDTPDREVLRRWIPGDFKTYLGILDGTITEQTLRDQ